jgi:hypothetical protein
VEREGITPDGVEGAVGVVVAGVAAETTMKIVTEVVGEDADEIATTIAIAKILAGAAKVITDQIINES